MRSANKLAINSQRQGETMLATLAEAFAAVDQPPCEPQPDLEYSGYPHWEAFLAEPNREQRAADWLKDQLNIHVYWPHYTVKTRCGGARGHRHRPRGVISCTLLAPVDFLLRHPKRDRILEWAGLRQRNYGRLLTKAEVEIIREIEGKLNVAPDKKTYNFKDGQAVRFLNELWAAFFGEAVVIAVASGGRISVKVKGKLFGGKDMITVPAFELEAM